MGLLAKGKSLANSKLLDTDRERARILVYSTATGPILSSKECKAAIEAVATGKVQYNNEASSCFLYLNQNFLASIESYTEVVYSDALPGRMTDFDSDETTFEQMDGSLS